MAKHGWLLFLIINIIMCFGCACASDNVYMIELDTSASTGYVWTYVMDTEKIVEETSSSYEQSNIAGAAGVRGKSVFEFKSIGAGEVSIDFMYHLDDEEREVIRTITVTLHVDEYGTISETSRQEEVTPDVSENE